MRLVGLTLRNADDRHDEEKNKDQHVDHASTGGLAGDAAVHVGIIVFAIAVAFRFGHDINAGDHADHAHDDADDRKCAHRFDFWRRIVLKITNYLIMNKWF